MSANTKQKETHVLTETFSPEASSDADVAADQNLPGPAVVGQIVLVGVRHRLEYMERYLVELQRHTHTHTL